MRAEIVARVLSGKNISAADQASWRTCIEQALTAHIDAGNRLRETSSPLEDVEAAVTGKKPQ